MVITIAYEINRREFLETALLLKATLTLQEPKVAQTSIEERVRQGNKSLASRILDSYHDIKSVILVPQGEDYFGRFSDYLNSVKVSGDLGTVRLPQVKSYLEEILHAVDRGIPSTFKPKDHEDSITMASGFILEHFKMEVEEFIKKVGITNLEKSDHQPGLYITLDPETGEVKKTMQVVFNNGEEARSVIRNVRSLYSASQDYFNQQFQILKGLKQISGYRDLLEKISSDRTLTIKRVDMLFSSHELHFLALPEVMRLAEQIGVDVKGFRSYLERNIPKLDFIKCMSQGEMYIKQSELIQKNQLLDDENVLKGYRFLAFLDTLNALVTARPEAKYIRTGTALWESLRKNPDQVQAITSTPAFQRQVHSYLMRVK